MLGFKLILVAVNLLYLLLFFSGQTYLRGDVYKTKGCLKSFLFCYVGFNEVEFYLY